MRDPRASMEKALGARGVARRRASGVWPLRRRPSGARVPAAPRRRPSGARFLTAKVVQCAGPRRLPGEGAWVRDKIAAKGPECATLRPRGVDARPKCSQGQRMNDFRLFSRIGRGSTSISRAFGRLRRAAAHRGPLAATLPQPAATRRPSGAAHRAAAPPVEGLGWETDAPPRLAPPPAGARLVLQTGGGRGVLRCSGWGRGQAGTRAAVRPPARPARPAA